MAPSPTPPRFLLVLSGLAALLALIAMVRLMVFMADDTRPGFSFLPSSQWEVGHSCASAYFVAAAAAGDQRNV